MPEGLSLDEEVFWSDSTTERDGGILISSDCMAVYVYSPPEGKLALSR